MNFSNLPAIVDRLAAVNAQIANLQSEAASLKQALVESGQRSIDGAAHRATVTILAGKITTDWRAVAMHFEPSRQLVTAHTATGEPFATVRLFGRTPAVVPSTIEG